MPDKTPEEDILSVLRAEWMAFFCRDFAGFAAHWAHNPNVVRMIAGPYSGTRTFRGWDTISASVKEGMRRFPVSVNPEDHLRWENLQISAGTDMAWVSYDQVAISPIQKIQASNFQHELKILQLLEGEWKAVCLSIIVPGIGRSETPQVELDVAGRIKWVNELAQERLKDHPGLLQSGSKLRARNRAYDAGLQSQIGRVVERLKYTNAPQALTSRLIENVPLGEDDYGQVHYCWVMAEQERVLVTFDDVHQTENGLDQAAKIFGLSPAQRKLAGLLAEGMDIPTAADIQDVTINTLRTQIRRMFDKTGTRSQAALISKLLSVHQPT